ncbi:MAG TPA: KTSC domain-containing protein [Chthoniobacterales bacterium]|nr:KTSC domain-containing protein [Chthoniobacterales bacterium]
MRRFPPVAYVVLLFTVAPLQAEPAAIVSHLKRVPVESTAVATVGYSKKLHALEIEFRNGAIYRYLDVDPEIYEALLKAESKARFYDDNIRHKYRSLHVRPRSS